MRMFKLWLFGLVFFCFCPPETWAAHHDLQALELQARLFAEQEWSGQAKLTFGQFNRTLKVASCAHPVPSWVGKERRTGATAVVMSCDQPRWNLRLPVRVELPNMQAVATARAISSGTVLTPNDVVLQAIPSGVPIERLILKMEDAVGKLLKRSLASGVTLRSEMLEREQVVRSGQKVRVFVRSSSFEVSADGVAMSNGAIGDWVRVRMSNGRFITGRARADGHVEILL